MSDEEIPWKERLLKTESHVASELTEMLEELLDDIRDLPRGRSANEVYAEIDKILKKWESIFK